MVTDILTMAKVFAGSHLSEEEEGILESLCQAAFLRWLGRLRPGLKAEDCAQAMTPACAWTAVAGFLAGRKSAEPMKGFTAGDVSVQYGEKTEEETAKQLLAQAELMMIPYTADDSFCFRGVRG